MEIQGYPMYLIYTDGRVWSKKGKGRFLKPAKDNDGYHHVCFTKDKKQKTFNIHRLVAENFIPNPENKPQVDHINRIKNDNRVENLRWATHHEQSENRKQLFKNNKTGHKYISNLIRPKYGHYYRIVKIMNGKHYFQRDFKNKIDAICYKYIMMIKIKSMLRNNGRKTTKNPESEITTQRKAEERTSS